MLSILLHCTVSNIIFRTTLVYDRLWKYMTLLSLLHCGVSAVILSDHCAYIEVTISSYMCVLICRLTKNTGNVYFCTQCFSVLRRNNFRHVECVHMYIRTYVPSCTSLLYVNIHQHHKLLAASVLSTRICTKHGFLVDLISKYYIQEWHRLIPATNPLL